MSKSLRSLEILRAEDWADGFIDAVIQEFDNINWTTEKCVERINNCKLKKQFGQTKFAEFLEDDDLIVDNELILLKAKILLESEGYVDASTYKNLVEYWGDMNKKDKDNVLVTQYEVIVRNYLRPYVESLYQNYIKICHMCKINEHPEFDRLSNELYKGIQQAIDEIKL